MSKKKIAAVQQIYDDPFVDYPAQGDETPVYYTRWYNRPLRTSKIWIAAVMMALGLFVGGLSVNVAMQGVYYAEEQYEAYKFRAIEEDFIKHQKHESEEFDKKHAVKPRPQEKHGHHDHTV